MLTDLLLFAADDPPPPDNPPQQPTWWPLILPLGIIILYFVLMRRRPDAAQKTLLASIKKGDKVLTTSGIIGTLISVSDKEDEVVIKLEDNCRVKMIKSSIARNLTQQEEAAKQKEKKQEEAIKAKDTK